MLKKCLEGAGISPEDAFKISALGHDGLYGLLSATDGVRRRFKGVEINLCSIVNAKSGLCREDCSFCSQSIKYSTNIPAYPMKPAPEIASAAKEASLKGVREFSIVASGTRIEKEHDIETLSEALSLMKQGAPVERCASLGMLKRDSLIKLKEAGLQSYHHNLETSASFFPKICTTHKYEEDLEVVRTAKGLGLYVCSGGIFGLGEGWGDRIELAFTLKGLDVDSIPINFLNPRPGTPLEGADNLTPVECLKIIAIFRLIMPEKDIVVCGGRQVNLRDLQGLVFAAGANGIMTGNCLTTQGRPPEEDLKMIEDLGLKPRGAS